MAKKRLKSKSWIFLDILEYFQMVLEIYGQSERFLYSLGNVLDSQEDLQTVWKTSW